MKSRHIVSFVIFLFVLPYAIASLALFVALQKCVGWWLRSRHGGKFKGFLQGQDVIWSMGDARANGVINCMAYVVVDKATYEPKRSVLTILVGLRKRFKEVLMHGGEEAFPKLFYQRKFFAGYYYWLHQESGTIDKYVRYLELGKESEFVTVDELRKKLSEIANAELPDGNTRNWELLIGNKPIETKTHVKFPVSTTAKLWARFFIFQCFTFQIFLHQKHWKMKFSIF